MICEKCKVLHSVPWISLQWMILPILRKFVSRHVYLQVPNLFNMSNFRFSGHETFFCRQQWLKKGYDYFKLSGNAALSSNISNAIVALGVGKNMVTSIDHWMKAFGIVESSGINQQADLIFDSNGYDPYLEDEGTLWLLHFDLCTRKYASIYSLVFKDYIIMKASNTFSIDKLLRFISRQHPDSSQFSNSENTLVADIKVLLSMYVSKNERSVKTVEDDFSAIFLDLGLISEYNNDYNVEKHYIINRNRREEIPSLLLYYLLSRKLSEEEKSSLSFDEFYNQVAIYLGMSVEGAEYAIQKIVEVSKGSISYRDNSGIKEIQSKKGVNPSSILKKYYNA